MDDGLADLNRPEDLFRTLEHDRARIQANPASTYAAFDFFVTAEHLLDWALPDSPGNSQTAARAGRRKSEPLLQIVSHIASGAKHFRASASHHKSVSHADVEEGGFDSQSFAPESFSPASFAVHGLLIELHDGSVRHVSELADQVVAFWKREIGIS